MCGTREGESDKTGVKEIPFSTNPHSDVRETGVRSSFWYTCVYSHVPLKPLLFLILTILRQFMSTGPVLMCTRVSSSLVSLSQLP